LTHSILRTLFVSKKILVKPTYFLEVSLLLSALPVD